VRQGEGLPAHSIARATHSREEKLQQHGEGGLQERKREVRKRKTFTLVRWTAALFAEYIEGLRANSEGGRGVRNPGGSPKDTPYRENDFHPQRPFGLLMTRGRT
jgi:hypothetical protein